MKTISVTIAFMLIFFRAPSFGEEPTGVNEIRKEIVSLYDKYVGLVKELRELEKNVKDFPATSLNISLVKKESGLRLTHVDIFIDDQPLDSHVYSLIENNALDAGGRHVFYKGEIKKGNHTLKVLYGRVDKGKPGKGTASLPFAVFTGSDFFIQLSVNKSGELIPEQVTF